MALVQDADERLERCVLISTTTDTTNPRFLLSVTLQQSHGLFAIAELLVQL